MTQAIQGGRSQLLGGHDQDYEGLAARFLAANKDMEIEGLI